MLWAMCLKTEKKGQVLVEPLSTHPNNPHQNRGETEGRRKELSESVGRFLPREKHTRRVAVKNPLHDTPSNTHTHTYIYTYIDAHTHKERERERE